MAPRAPAAASEDCSRESSIVSASSNTSSSTTHHGGLELSLSSHSIAKQKTPKKGPIIRVVHVFAPKLIQTDVANFRRLVQKLTGNQSSSDEEEEEEGEETSHDHANVHGYCNKAIKHTQQLELRYHKEREASMPAVLDTQYEENCEDPLLHYGFLQAAGLSSSNHSRFAISINENSGYFAANEAGLTRIEERDECFSYANQDELARNDEANDYLTGNYDYEEANSHGSPSSLDSSSSRGDPLNYERGNNPCVFSDELELMEGFNPSYPLMNFDDQHYPQLFMSALDPKLDSSLLNPTW